MAWENKTADSNWSVTYGTWDGNEWDSSLVLGRISEVLLTPSGSWHEDYRPTSIRVTFSGQASLRLEVEDSNSGSLANELSYESEVEVELNWQGYDLGSFLIFTYSGPFSVTAIEFNVEEASSPSEGTPSGSPSASPSEGTPSASPSEGTPSGSPSASPSEGTPSASPSEGTPSPSPEAEAEIGLDDVFEVGALQKRNTEAAAFDDSFLYQKYITADVLTDALGVGDSVSETVLRHYNNMIVRPHIDIVRIAVWELGSLTLRLTDRTWNYGYGKCVYEGVIYEPLVLDFGSLETGEIDPITYNPTSPSATIVIENSTPIGGASRLTSLFSTYKPHYSSITIYEFVVDTLREEVSTTKALFAGELEDFSDALSGTVTLEFVGYMTGLKNSFPAEYVDSDTYPGADPDDFGKMLPQCWGPCKKVPFMAVDSGSISSLVSEVDSTQVTIEISDASGFGSTGYAYIDEERIYYSGKTGNTLTGITRGVSGTTAVSHSAGATVAEAQDHYDYIIGCKVTQFNGVFVRDASGVDIRQSGNYTAYTGQSGDELAAYPGKAAIRFSALPKITKQVNIEVEDEIDVSDTISVDEGSHGHTGEENIEIWNFDSYYSPSGYMLDPEHLFDGDLTSYAQIMSGNHRLTRSQYAQKSGVPLQYRMCVYVFYVTATCYFQFPYVSGTTCKGLGPRQMQITPGTNILVRSQWYDCEPYIDATWDAFNNAEGYLCFDSGAYANIGEVWIEVKWEEAIQEGPATGVEKLGAAIKIGTAYLQGNSVADTVIGGQVSADIDGIPDETGDYGGLGNSIARPDYQMRHILVDRCGLDSARVNSSSYTAAGQDFSDNSVTLGVVLLEKPVVADLLREIAFQAQAMQFWEPDGHHILYLPKDDSSLSEDATLVPSEVFLQDRPTLNYTDRVDIVNNQTVVYDKEWAVRQEILEEMRNSVRTTDTDSISEYGTKVGDILEVPFIVTSVHISNFVDWFMNQRSFPRKMLEITAPHHMKRYDKGQLVNFEFSYGDSLHQAFAGLVESGTEIFRVLNRRFLPNGVRLQLVGPHETNRVIAPTFSLDSDSYASAQSLEIYCETVGASIYYTTDGSDPTQSSTLYAGAISVLSTTTVKARAYKGGMSPSRISSRIFTLVQYLSLVHDNYPDLDTVRGLSRISDTTAIGCKDYGYFLKTTDGGLTWEDYDKWPFAGGYGYGLLVLSATNWILTTHSSIFSTNDGGENWTKRFDVDADGEYGAYLPTHIGNGVILVGTSGNGKIYRSADYGVNWAEVEKLKDYNSDYATVEGFCSFDGNNIVASVDKVTFRSTDGGQNWSLNKDFASVYPDEEIKHIIKFSSTVGVIVPTYNGSDTVHVWRTTDAGLTWSENEEEVFCSHSYYTGFKPGVAIDSLTGFVSLWDRTRSPDEYWIYKTEDAGLTWTENHRYDNLGENVGLIADMLKLTNSIVVASCNDNETILRLEF